MILNCHEPDLREVNDVRTICYDIFMTHISVYHHTWWHGRDTSTEITTLLMPGIVWYCVVLFLGRCHFCSLFRRNADTKAVNNVLSCLFPSHIWAWRPAQNKSPLRVFITFTETKWGVIPARISSSVVAEHGAAARCSFLSAGGHKSCAKWTEEGNLQC